MEARDHPPSNRHRDPWVAVLLAALSPAVGMLYIGRLRRAVVYLGLPVLSMIGAVFLARNGLWPAGLSWISIALLIRVICMVDGYRIAKTYEAGFMGPWFTTWKGLAAVAVSFYALALAIRVFLFEPFQMPSSSMLPTLQEGDQFFVSKLAFSDAPPQRGDIVVFRIPSDPSVNYIKRVVGLPSDVVNYEQDRKRLTINGTGIPLELLGAYEGDPQYQLGRENLDGVEYSVLLMQGRLSVGGTYKVPEGHYFVLGDNRDNSRDSRFEGVEFIPAENIVGKATFIWWNTEDPKRAGIVLE